MRWRDSWLQGGGTRYRIRAIGDGDDVAVLLHGWPETGDAWRRVAPMLADTGWRVVCPDLKGFGESVGDRRVDPEVLAAEMADVIRALHVPRVLLVGHDWGGAVALGTAFRHPDLVRGLVMVSSPYRQLDLRRSLHIPLFNLPVLPELAFKVAPGPLVRTAVRIGAVQHEGFDDDLLEQYAVHVGARPRAWLSYYRTMSRRVVREWAVRRVARELPWTTRQSSRPALPVPAHVVWGADDPATPAHLAPRVAFDLGASLDVLDDVGHFPHQEDPRALATSLVRFASGLPRPSAPALADVVPLARPAS